MKNPWALVVCAILIFTTVRGLINGSATPSGDSLMRVDQPIAYWSVIIGSCGAAAVLAWKAFN